jgi:hypothetical protein
MQPQLNVNIVLFNPLFMDDFIVVRRSSSVDPDGRVQSDDVQIPTTGVVQPSGENTQERPKQYATGRKSCLVITQYRLREQSEGFLPDLVIWRGDTYLVQTIEDFTNYGPGFVQAYCTSQDLQDAPPEDIPVVNPLAKDEDGNLIDRGLPAPDRPKRLSQPEAARGLAAIMGGRNHGNE